MQFQYKGKTVEVLMVRKGMKCNWGFAVEGILSPQHARSRHAAKQSAIELIDYQGKNPSYKEERWTE